MIYAHGTCLNSRLTDVSEEVYAKREYKVKVSMQIFEKVIVP